MVILGMVYYCFNHIILQRNMGYIPMNGVHGCLWVFILNFAQFSRDEIQILCAGEGEDRWSSEVLKIGSVK